MTLYNTVHSINPKMEQYSEQTIYPVGVTGIELYTMGFLLLKNIIYWVFLFYGAPSREWLAYKYLVQQYTGKYFVSTFVKWLCDCNIYVRWSSEWFVGLDVVQGVHWVWCGMHVCAVLIATSMEGQI